MDVLRFLRANTLARASPAAQTPARLTTRVGPAVVRAKRRAWTHAGDHAAGRISPVGGGREAQKRDRDADEGREYPRPIERVSERERTLMLREVDELARGLRDTDLNGDRRVPKDSSEQPEVKVVKQSRRETNAENARRALIENAEIKGKGTVSSRSRVCVHH